MDESFELTVTDTGQGIAPEFLPAVFDRFTQADTSTTRVHKGLGLGLAICRHLVEQHGGVISVDSPGLGLGSTFTLRLPMLASDGADGGHGTARVVGSRKCFRGPGFTGTGSR